MLMAQAIILCTEAQEHFGSAAGRSERQQQVHLWLQKKKTVLEWPSQKSGIRLRCFGMTLNRLFMMENVAELKQFFKECTKIPPQQCEKRSYHKCLIAILAANSGTTGY